MMQREMDGVIPERVRMRLLAGAGPWIVALSLAIGVAAGSAQAEDEGSSPAAVDGAVTVSVDEAARLHADGVVFVDVRNPRLYARRHIPGAVHLDLSGAYNLANLEATVSRDQPFVIYCSGVKCSRSSTAADFAVEWGFTGAHYFREGIVGWRDAGLPTAEAD
jgi:rhodanese-related sulfurtransferase